MEGLRRDYDPWHDVCLPHSLARTDQEVSLEPDDAEDKSEEGPRDKESSIHYANDLVAFVEKVLGGSGFGGQVAISGGRASYIMLRKRLRSGSGFVSWKSFRKTVLVILLSVPGKKASILQAEAIFPPFSF